MTETRRPSGPVRVVASVGGFWTAAEQDGRADPAARHRHERDQIWLLSSRMNVTSMFTL
jgi:hypothetical protein